SARMGGVSMWRVALLLGVAAGAGDTQRPRLRRLQAYNNSGNDTAAEAVQTFTQQTPFPESCFAACPDLALVNGSFGSIYDDLSKADLVKTTQYASAIAAFATSIRGLFCEHRTLAACIASNPASCDAAMSQNNTRRLNVQRPMMRRPRPVPQAARWRSLQATGGYGGYGDSTTQASGGYGGYGDSTTQASGGYGGYGDSTTQASGGYGGYG
ncbi:unnamed protein product, partial [Symbiodinium natans]